MDLNLLTKVASGVAYGDVSNQAIRNILTEISKNINGKFTEQEMVDTLEYFDWKCPYTGRDLRESIEKGDGSYATDHIYPQNRVWCGLNVIGNLVIVDKRANSKKGKKDVKSFLEEDSDYWRELGVDKATRLERLEKIIRFQEDYGYDPENIREKISSPLFDRYEELRREQEKCIEEMMEILKEAGIKTIERKLTPKEEASDEEEKDIVITASAKAKAKRPKHSTELIFFPSDETEFKKLLLDSKSGHFILTYDDGKVMRTNWNASKLKESSDLRGNIESKTFWRNKNKEGLLKVEVFVG